MNVVTVTLTAKTLEVFKGKDETLYIKGKDEISFKVEPFNDLVEPKSLNELRDEYHSIGELYEFRKAYNALLFNEWAKEYMIRENQINNGFPVRANFVTPLYDVHKSWRHNDGEDCFGGGWFIVVAILPTGQITNHYKAEDWDLFQIPAVEKAKYEYDGHTPADTLERMKQLLNTK